MAAPTFSSAAATPVFDSPPAPHAAAPDAAPPAPPAQPAPTYLPAPPVPAAATAPAPPAGPLPTYGADIRPPVPTVSAPTPPPPTAPAAGQAAAPAPAPLSTSAGASAVTPVARQPVAATPPAVGGQFAVATVGGAAAGAASAQTSARARLQRLVDFVADQQPRLRWAAGDRADGTTVLVTDLASGWIPPGIAIPSGVQLLEPACRRGGVEALLGEVNTSVSYAPSGQRTPAEKLPTTTRARRAPAVDELGWQLGRATRWRDGLPRLAHTLAKAASAGTGVLDSEISLLREHLVAIADQVLGYYPDRVAIEAVGNWQLLAAIDALVAADDPTAHYHFAWFLAGQGTTESPGADTATPPHKDVQT